MVKTVTPLYTFVNDRAKQSPTARALSDEQFSYSYEELSRLSGSFARRIQELGDVAGKHVGLLYDRSAQSIVLLLAIMKAGGIYVPLNRSMPSERLSVMIEEAGIALIIAPDVPTITLKRDITTLSPTSGSPADPTFSSQPTEVAYAIFTSGSTGLPKLALLSHNAVAHVVTALTERYYITGDDRVLQFANLSFDGSLSEIFCAFVAGAELVVPDEQTAQSITQLSSYVDEKAVTVAILPSSLLVHLPLSYTHFKTIVVAGEPCPSTLAKAITKRVPHFINAYGPTECAICVSTYEVPKDFDGDVTPIGEALPGVDVFVLDDEHKPVPDGTTGELYVGGPTLFNGYYDDETKTTSVLIQDEAGQTRYKTGDFVSRKDGVLTYVSRSDDYIKLHGIRISPLEIEEAVQRFHKSIRGVAVVLVEDVDDSYLVAFYSSDQEFPVSDIVEFAKNHLPPYAIPNQFVHLTELLLTPNKKVDRRALTTQAQSLSHATSTSADFLQTAWQSILHIDVDEHTDFFFAGGDSLKAMRLLALVDQTQGTALNLSDLYHHATFGDFKAFIKSLSPSSPAKPYTPDELTPYETMLWSASAHAGNPATYTLTEIVKPDFVVDGAKLEQAVIALSNSFTAPSYRYVLEEERLKKQAGTSGISPVQHGTLTQNEFDELTQSLASSAIDVATDPLITLHLALIAGQSVIVIHAHHIVLSASMLGLFLKELWRNYTGASTTLLAEEAPRDFTESEADFWRNAYDTGTDYVQLPWTGIRQPKPKNNGQTLVTTLDGSVDDFVRELGVTKFVFYRSIFSLLMHRLSGQSSFYIGSSVDIRHSDFLGSQPAMLNTVPIRSSLEPTETLSDFVQNVQENVRAVLEHRFMSLHDIIKLHPFEQDRLVGPFNVMFDYIEKPDMYTIPGLGTLQSTQLFNATAKYDLTLTVSDGSHTELCWEYDADLLDERTVQQFARMFSHVCHTIIKDAHQPITNIPLLDAKEMVTMLSIGKGDVRTRPVTTFYERFAQEVSEHPDTIAVKHAGNDTSYQDLQYLVDHYSAVLIEQKLPAEAPVGVFMDRSVEMVAIITALWRLGYAYVPIETNFPTHRITAILETTRMSLILTKSAFRAKLPVDTTAQIVDETYQPSALQIPSSSIAPTTLAYIIFTSGSTGTPKGVMIEHAGMMNHAEGMIEYLHLDRSSTIAQTASHSFDISVWQLTTLLIAGGTIALYSKDEQANLDDFTSQLLADNVTLLELVPSYITILLEYLEDAGTQHRLHYIKALISTGENISWRIVESWHRNVPNAQLLNAYGPAEASDDTNLFTFQSSSAVEQRGLPVGTSLQNVDVYVLDEALNPQPIGIQGEIYIAGIAVGRGYINDPERTAKSFITHPHTGERMYKTGDLGYWSSNGQLMYTGRSDFQVKLRGFRIELEEIEAHIARYPHITATAVVVVDKNNAKQLHAYVTADMDIDGDVVLDYLRNRLPDYMVPSTIIQLSALPLNNSGKIDRPFLANKERLRFKEAETTVVLSDEELAVIAVWREVFDLDHVSVDDDYYALGGDSITSFRIYAKLHATGLQLTLQDILAYPVLKDFARTLTPKAMTAQVTEAIQEAFALTPIQARLLAQASPDLMAQNIRIEGRWERARLDDAIQAVAKKQGVFYLAFTANEQHFASSTRFEQTFTFVESTISEREAFEKLTNQLAQGALFAYGAEGDNDKVTTLYMSINHLVVDIVSWNILVTAITDAYTNTPSSDIDYSFGLWAQALRTAEDPSSEITAYWQDILNQSASASRALEERFSRDVPSQQVVTRTIALPSTALSETSIYLAVLHALEQLLNADHASILIETHGRYGNVVNVNVSQTVGWFTQLLPLSGTTAQDIEKILRVNDKTKLAYGLATQRGLLNVDTEPAIIVNYLGKFTAKDYSLKRNAREIPINSELMECTVYYDESALHIELVLYATPTESDFIETLFTTIAGSFTMSPIVDTVPATPTQQGLLYVERAYQHGSLYHEQYIAELTGDLDIERLQTAWQKIIDTHTILRTIFDWDGQSQPTQIVLRQHPASFIVLPDTLNETERTSFTTHDAQAEFHFDTRPPHRVTLLKTDNHTYWFVFTYHHLLLDGASVSALFEHLADEYNRSTDSASLNDYGTYARWMQSGTQQNAAKAWKEYSAGIALPSVAGILDGKGATHEYYQSLDVDETTQILSVAQTNHLTPNSIFQTLWAFTLAEAKQRPVICVGSPTMVKPLDGSLESVIGLCMTTIPYITAFDTTTSLLDMAIAHQQRWGNLIEHGRLSLSEIKKAIGYHHYGDPFETILTYTDARKRTLPELEGIDWEVLSHHEVTQYPLSVDVVVHNETIELKATYHESYGDSETTAQLIQAFADNVRRFAEHPQTLPAIHAQPATTTKKAIPTQQGDTDTIRKIADVWSRIFDTAVTDDTNFFELGGDSISSLRIVSKLLEAGIAVSMRDIFDSPTPQQLAGVAVPAGTSSAHSTLDLPPEVSDLAHQLYGDNVGTVVHASSVQRGLLNRPVSKQSLYHDQSTFTYQGSMDPELFGKAWSVVVNTTDALRMRYFEHDTSWYAVVLKEQSLSLDFKDVREDPHHDKTIQQTITSDLADSFNPKDSPLIRLRLYQTGDDHFVFFLSFHLLITDGWSFAFLLDDVFTAYEQLLAGQEPSLTRRQPTYTDYLQSLTPSDIIAGRQHWRTYLKDVIIPESPMLTDFSQLNTISVQLDEKETASLQSFARTQSLSVNSLVQAGWAITNAESPEPILFGATISSRLHRGIHYDDTIGLFFNDIPVVARVDTDNVSELAGVIQRDFQANAKYSYLSAYEIASLVGKTDEQSPYDSLIVFENYPKVQEDSLKQTRRGNVANTDYWRRDMADIPKTLYVEIRDDVTTIKLSYNTEVVTAETAQNLVDTFTRVLKTCIR